MKPAMFPPTAEGAYVATTIAETVARLARHGRHQAATCLLAGYCRTAPANLSVIPVNAAMAAVAGNLRYWHPAARWAPDWGTGDRPAPVEIEVCAWATAMMNAASNKDREGLRAAWGFMAAPLRPLVAEKAMEALALTNDWCARKHEQEAARRARPS